MEKKRSIGVTVVGWIEIIIGLLGTIVFAMCLFGLFWIATKANADGEEAMGLLGIIPMLYFTFLSPLILFAGIGVIKLKSWGRKINLIVIPVFILFFGTLISLAFFNNVMRYIRNHDTLKFIWLAVRGFFSPRILLPVLFLFLLHPNVKEQFK